MASSPITSAIAPGFSGVSKYASSLQSVLSRAVAIASLPLDQLNAGLNTLTAKQSALQSVDTAFLSLQQSIGSLQSSVSAGLLNSSISDAGIVSATVQQGTLPGSYSLEVTNLGTYSTALTASGTPAVTDPSKQGLSVDAPFVLRVGNTSATITPAGTSLQDLATAINSSASDRVQATIVNIGSSGSPDYRLSLRAVKLGSDSIDFSATGTSLVSTSSPGSLASYKINGLPDALTSDTRSIHLAPGLTINLLGQSVAGHATTINVVKTTSSLASALSAFANAYNAAADTISAQHGRGGGVLQGDSLLQSLSGILHQLGTYNNGGASAALANFGLTLDQGGHLSVNTSVLASAADADFNGLLSVLGSSTSGGFLHAATKLLAGAEDPASGTIRNEEASASAAITAQQKRVSDEQAVIADIQKNLTAQIAKADASIAKLQSQLSYVTSLFAAYNGTASSTNGLSSNA